MEIKQFLAILYRRKWWIIQSVILFIIIAYSFISRQPHVYLAKGMLMVDRPIVINPTIESNYNYSTTGMTELLSTHIKILESADFAEKVKKLLKTGREINGIMGEAIPNTRIIQISYENTDREFAADVINMALIAFQKESLNLNRKDATSYKVFVESQLEKVKKSLSEIEDKIKTFKERNRITDISHESQRLIDRNSTIQDEYRKYIMELNEAESEERILAEKLGGDWNTSLASSIISEDPVVSDLRQQLTKAEQEYNLMRIDYAPDSSPVKKSKQKIDYLQKLLESELKKLLGKYDKELVNFNVDDVKRQIMNGYVSAYARKEALKTRGNVIKKSLEEVSEQLASVPKQEITLSRLQLDLEVTRGMYRNLLEKLEEAKLEEASKGSNISIIQKARIPSHPIRPEKFKFMLLSALAGLVTGLALAFFLESIDSTVRSLDDVVSCFPPELPLLAPLPWLPSKNGYGSNSLKALMTKEKLSKYDYSVPVDAYRQLRTNLRFVTKSEDKVFCILSAGKNESKSHTLTELGISFAITNKKVLIIDLDLRNPEIHTIFNIPNELGSSYLLREGGDFRPFLQKVSNNLYVICAGKADILSTELLEINLQPLIKAVRNHFDVILLDTPPLEYLVDGLLIAECCDAAILIARIGKATRKGILNSLKALANSKANLVGYLVKESSSILYYYKYSKYYKYKKGYY